MPGGVVGEGHGRSDGRDRGQHVREEPEGRNRRRRFRWQVEPGPCALRGPVPPLTNWDNGRLARCGNAGEMRNRRLPN